MRVREVIINLCQYYRMNRAVGHTQAMLNGVIGSSKDCLVLVSSYKQGLDMGLKKQNLLTIESFENRGSVILHGRNQPLAVDHFAMVQILEEAYREIIRLEKHIMILGDALKNSSGVI